MDDEDGAWGAGLVQLGHRKSAARTLQGLTPIYDPIRTLWRVAQKIGGARTVRMKARVELLLLREAIVPHLGCLRRPGKHQLGRHRPHLRVSGRGKVKFVSAWSLLYLREDLTLCSLRFFATSTSKAALLKVSEPKPSSCGPR